jgi:hypothetical protein
MSFSAKRYSEKHHEIAKAAKKVLFMWEMDKRYMADVRDRSKIQCCGVISREKARRIWAIIQDRDEAEAKPYEFLNSGFLELMNEIGRYGEEKYGADSFHARAQTGDRSRGSLLRTRKEQILNHARQHITDYENGILHDHFGDASHQLAAAAFNLLMEFYFSQGE